MAFGDRPRMPALFAPCALTGRRLLRTAAFLCVAAALGRRCAADTIVLKNGNILEGRVIHAGSSKVLIKLPYGTMAIERRQIREIKKTSPVKTHLAQGELLLYHNDFERALEEFREAVRLAPESEIARSKLARARLLYARHLENLRRYEEALELYDRIAESGVEAEKGAAGAERIRALLAAFSGKLKEAKAALTTGKIERARKLLKDLWEVYPQRRKLVGKALAYAETRLGDQALTQGAYKKAGRHFESALTYYPDWFPLLVRRLLFARVKVAQTLIENGEYTEAEKILTETLAYAPESDALHYLLGRALEEQGRLQEAIAHYERVQQDPKRGFDPAEAERRLKELAAREAQSRAGRKAERAGAESAVVKTKHFTVQAPGRSFAQKIADALELHFRRIAPSFGVKSFEKPCEVTVYPSEEIFRKAVQCESWAPANSRWDVKLGHLRRHQIRTYKECPQLFSSVLPHELTHILTAAALSYRPDIPLWASEGLAVDNEPAFKHRFYANVIALAAKQNRLIRIRDLLAFTSYPGEKEVELFYAQSHALVRYLVKRRGFKRFLKFLRELGGPNDWVTWERFYGFQNPSALENHWLHWAFK